MRILSPERATERFWEKVIRRSSGCLEFIGGSTTQGYGAAYFGFRNGHSVQVEAHRLAWTLKRGPIPPGRCLLNECGMKKCVNDEHWRLARTPNPYAYDPDLEGSSNGQA